MDMNEGFSLVIDEAEWLALPAARMEGIPKGFKGRRYRADCIIVGWRRGDGAAMGMRFRQASMGPRWAAVLEERVPL